MGFQLAPTATADGFRLEAHDAVGSTNALALERAMAGDPGKLWVVSKKQESGRGRRGRAWATPEGNLAATLLKVLDHDLQYAATLGFVAGLALADALDAVAPNARFSVGVDGGSGQGVKRFELKWPNDVLASGAKLAGILLESTLLGQGRLAIAIGIGVNVVAHPTEVPYPATSLASLGAGVDAETLFLALSDAWSENERIWAGGRGLAAIRKRWLGRAAGLGSEVAVRIEGNVVRGVFETIDEDCRFVIRDTKGEAVKIAAGDVHFGAVASAGAA
ncbi:MULTISPECIES: biotin--[acetyl-CoA-carboxylase] ligase [Aminobacter]|jgi:BirA family biotin operon repressor/biotin-[acetyl-CoA-carboxylase] ligase|uniref:biotin--[biotin carboxyl-carrier protein] ligase n=1 Tax=Aminobacter ciceronei TaxID=150723 RepID=A0ABR6C162_9HYPH|nr:MULTISPECIES: biotin--[acetyl-CoA-carboxylase] ligase [Aminobacter]MBA8904747.1 BirA family biotin operon repressor/biotin-[acetyl-CoA-carboxylase] ligase [Aminobacter ciceronei]MBA9018699.1 BirA family biotin operon repressor/biotin-[acetyl-CoA-carboxylase] ligase [Aminobacter ciceronei]MRX31459.1 biotin--[acetyl-CoA-carboxylase] ligase [Aminobacter sp. MDW-2]QNH31965.1 biotin--[acetyl-CoA-carboxylase] ligase [Aminobacter sp. MDW-2]BBD38609.1 biotin--[acetyl-CoA-carboxylase] ligase [Aminob